QKFSSLFQFQIHLQIHSSLLILSSFLLFFSTSHHHHHHFYAQPLKKVCSISSSTMKEGMLMLKHQRCKRRRRFL
ncbi:hypothetical protein LINPERHAP1_LOCUS8292, partial [Linum perenne]